MEVPVNTSDPNNMVGILINNLINAELLRRSNVSRLPDLEQRALIDITTVSHYIGPHMSKCAQTTETNVDYHVYPSGKQVIKAFTTNDFQFYNKNSQFITEPSDSSIEVVDRVRITWRIQKNRQNTQRVTLPCDKTNRTICPSLPHHVWCSEHVAFYYRI